TKGLVGDTSDLADELRQMNGSGSRQNYYSATVSPDLNTYSRLKNAVAKDIQVLKTKLVRQWQNESRTRNIINEHDGRLSVNEAIRCRISGEDNYLVKKTKRINHKPAVCVLADLSGSMSDNGAITDQAKALIALTEACDLAGIPLNIMGFSDYAVTVKKWNDPMPKARALLGGMNKTISGTELPIAMFEGVRTLQSRKEQKKILITLTDGDIGMDGIMCRNIMQYAEKSIPGIEFYGLGIGVNLNSLFKKGGRVNPAQLSQSLLEILSK
ncbi:MAG: VWA domain-containing protein, partial [Thiotrichales bacterium]|nr:VWA domain-containing protein [Thiotrichales bacterium]